MSIKSLNSKAFGTVETLLVILIVVILGGTGYYVYHANKNANDTYKSANNSGTPKYSNKQASGSSTATKTYYSKLPNDLQSAILKTYQDKVPDCVDGSKLVDIHGKNVDPPVTYDAKGFAVVAVGCDFGAYDLFVKASGNWQDVASAQGTFSCDTLKKYSVPVYSGTVKLVDECLASGSGQYVPYKG